MFFEVGANIVVVIHFIVIIFMLFGLFIPKNRWIRLKVFHSYFVFLVLILNLILGNCPLTILEQRLRKLANPDYVIKRMSFTERFLQKNFGFSISDDAIFVLIAMIAVVGLAQFFSIKRKK